jgi:pyrrolidone-carboxylate peptidase
MKVLVTAFKPFGNKENNYSQEVIKYIENVDKVILDVCYDKCYTDLIDSFNLDEYDLIICLGEARMRSTLMVETTAKNISSCSLMDNAGVIKKDEKIVDNEIEELNTLVDLSNLKDIVELSHDAGKFVCNNIYFHLLNNCPSKSLFIHIPECHDLEENYLNCANIISRIIKNIQM